MEAAHARVSEGNLRPYWVKLCIGLLLSFFAVSCTSYDPKEYYDPDATIKSGLIVEKEIIGSTPGQWADSSPPLVAPIPIGSGWAVLILILTRTNSPPDTPVYQYIMQGEDGQKTAVLTTFPAHDIGQCVSIFLSDRPDYPRMAAGGDCQK